MTREDAEGTTDTAACRFWMVSQTVTRRPFCKFVRRGREHGYAHTYPVTGGFRNIFSDLLGRQTEGTDLGSKGS